MASSPNQEQLMGVAICGIKAGTTSDLACMATGLPLYRGCNVDAQCTVSGVTLAFPDCQSGYCPVLYFQCRPESERPTGVPSIQRPVDSDCVTDVECASGMIFIARQSTCLFEGSVTISWSMTDIRKSAWKGPACHRVIHVPQTGSAT